jgi:hypothetical protein
MIQVCLISKIKEDALTSEKRYLHLIRQDCPVPAGTHVVAYCRDSGGEDQDRSVQQQIEVIHEYCDHHQLILERIYADEAKTASNADKRDQLQYMEFDLHQRFKMIKDQHRRERYMEAHPFALICWKSNRLSRDSLHSTHMKADLRLRGITIIDLITTGDTGDAGMNALIESFQNYHDQKLLDEIGENSRRGLAQLVSLRDNDPIFRRYNPDYPTNEGRYLGIMPGTLPMGFRAESIQVGTYERRRQGGMVSGEARVVQRTVPNHENNVWERCYLAWQMRHAGEPIKKIMEATQIYKSASSYSSFFENRIYTGDFEYGENLLVDFLRALIPREWYEEEQKRKQERAVKLQKMQADPNHEPRRVVSRHLLSGLVFCGGVAGEEHATFADTVPAREGKRSRWDFYICCQKKNSRDKICNSERIGAAALDQAVVENLLENVLTMDNLRPIADSLADSLAEQNKSILQHLQATQGRLDEVCKSIEQLLNAIEKVGLSPNIQARLAQREAEERDLIAEAANLEEMMVKPVDIPKITDQRIQEWIGHMREALTGEDIDLARRAIRQFVAKIVVNKKAGVIYYTFPFSDLSRLGNVPHTGFQSGSRFSLEEAILRILNQLYKDTPPRIYRTKVQRNKEIRERYSKRESVPSLALEYEVTEQRVYQILNLKQHK